MNFRIKKTKVAFWAVSNCDTPNHRERYAKKLQEYVEIDIFSRVGLLDLVLNLIVREKL